ncbi:chaplin [Streptomyces sp. XY152]|uniref:chaplin n=1 Tax=Streptomyces sp. XY152 TaxID=1415560 RepID=UPI002D21877C|nr:chaplin [Streptomyces sp. XY152]
MAVAVPAYADAGAEGVAAGSPGVGAGNTVRLPVHVPVNVCGNTVNVVGLLNPAAGNACVDEDTGGRDGGATGSSAATGTQDSPGVVSGNGARVPVHAPVNVSGNSVNVLGAGNASAGGTSASTSGERPGRPAGPAPAAHPPRPGAAHGPAAPRRPRRHGRRPDAPGPRRRRRALPGRSRPVPSRPPADVRLNHREKRSAPRVSRVRGGTAGATP